MLLGLYFMSGVFGIVALELVLEHIEITGKKPWKHNDDD